MDVNTMQAELDALKAENAALKLKKVRPLTMKVSTKGGLSVYGLGRFPVTLYIQQWMRLIAAVNQIGEFIEANRTSFTVKD